MKATAKHLPIEGRIKIGDRGIHVSGQIQIFNKLNGVEADMGWWKAKLFILTQDVEKGDDVINMDYVFLDGLKTRKVIGIKDSLIFIDVLPDNFTIWQNKEVTYKILGDAPEALDLKEGMMLEVDMREDKIYSICIIKNQCKQKY